VERSVDTARRRLGGRDVGSQAELARQLPVQAFHPESHRLISGGPRERRQFIDWGVFHVEHGFLEAWRRYQRAVRQRNAALRRGDWSVAHAFDEELVAMGEQVTECRHRYVDLLAHELPKIQSRLFPEHPVRLRLRRGWSEDRDLTAALEGDRERDLRDGYTHLGPHRADLDLRIQGRPVSEVASRGQQKAVVAGLVLLQSQIYGARVGRTGIVLVDDLPSELDLTHRAAVLDLLREMRVQVFVTAIEAEQIDLSRWDRPAVFHVEQGQLRELI
jgi:DNA replication and repair protein RecF